MHYIILITARWPIVRIRFRLEGRSRPRASAYDDMTVVRIGARADGTGGELVAAVATNGSVDVLTGAADADVHANRHVAISGAPQQQNLDWGAGSMQHDLQALTLQPQIQPRPPVGGRAVPPSLRGGAAEHRQNRLQGLDAPAAPPPLHGRKRTGP